MEDALRSIGRKVTAQKMKTAGATGVLALQEHGLKEVPEGLFLLVKLRVREEGGENAEQEVTGPCCDVDGRGEA